MIAHMHARVSKRTLLLPALCLLACCAFFGCAPAEEAAVQQSAAVDVQAAARGDLSLRSSYIGSLAAESTVYVIPFVSGEVLEVAVKVGDSVVAGDVLARLDDKAAQLQVDSAEVSYDSAKAGVRAQMGGAWDVQSIQTQTGLEQLYASLYMYERQLQDSWQQLRDLRSNLSDAEAAMNQAQSSYAGAQKKLLTASNLAANFAGTVAQYPSTAALGTAYADARTHVEKQNAAEADAILQDPTRLAAALAAEGVVSPTLESLVGAVSLHNALQGTGIAVEYLTQIGLAAYEQEATLAGSTYEKALGSYSALRGNEPTLENAITQLEGAIDQAKISIRSTQEIADLTDTQVKQETRRALESQADAARVGIDAAQLQLDFYTLTAPISGTVESVGVVEHGLASSAAPAFTISNANNMLVTLYVSEDVRNALQPGQPVSVERKGVQYTAHITEIGTSVDLSKGLFLVKARVDTRGDTFAPGTSISVTADVFREQNALLIPYSAIYYEANQAYVFIAAGGIAQKVYVETGISDGTSIAILSGLNENDAVITSWFPGLRDGLPVSYDAAQLRKQAVPAQLAPAPAVATAPPAATPTPVAEPAPTYVEITGEDVNFRAEPDAKGRLLRKLPLHEQAVLLGEAGDWYHIALGEETGYVSAAYARILPAEGTE